MRAGQVLPAAAIPPRHPGRGTGEAPLLSAAVRGAARVHRPESRRDDPAVAADLGLIDPGLLGAKVGAEVRGGRAGAERLEVLGVHVVLRLLAGDPGVAVEILREDVRERAVARDVQVHEP